jgi:hypothetical protein
VTRLREAALTHYHPAKVLFAAGRRAETADLFRVALANELSPDDRTDAESVLPGLK